MMNPYKRNKKDRMHDKMISKTKEELLEIIGQLKKENIFLEESILKKITDNEILAGQIKNLQEKKFPLNNKISWTGKIITVLTETDHPMQAGEIADYIEQADKEIFKDAIDKYKLLSAYLSNAKKYGRIKQYKIKGTRGHFYALPRWFDENGDLKKEYKQKEPIA